MLEHAVAHDRDPMPHRHRLDLIVGDVDSRGLEPALQLDQLGPGLDPQLCVEIRKRLVHEKRLRLADDRARERDALALPTRQLCRLAVEQLRQPEGVGCVGDKALTFRGRGLATLQRELDVPRDRHVWVQRIALEHHRDVAILRFDMRDVDVTDADLTLARVFQARDHAQRGRLPAARRAEQHEELAIRDLEIEVAHSDDVAEALRHVVEDDAGHRRGI